MFPHASFPSADFVAFSAPPILILLILMVARLFRKQWYMIDIRACIIFVLLLAPVFGAGAAMDKWGRGWWELEPEHGGR
jgi:hypothetical protein